VLVCQLTADKEVVILYEQVNMLTECWSCFDVGRSMPWRVLSWSVSVVVCGAGQHEPAWVSNLWSLVS